MKESGGPFAGKVMVRRVFRGDKGLEGRMVMVEGFGSKNICLSTPRLGDTKLFFMKNLKLRQNIYPKVFKFKLNDNILKLNLRNLKTLWKLEDTTDRSNYNLYLNIHKNSIFIFQFIRIRKSSIKKPPLTISAPSLVPLTYSLYVEMMGKL